MSDAPSFLKNKEPHLAMRLLNFIFRLYTTKILTYYSNMFL